MTAHPVPLAGAIVSAALPPAAVPIAVLTAAMVVPAAFVSFAAAMTLAWPEFPVTGAWVVAMLCVVVVTVVVDFVRGVFPEAVRHPLVVDFCPGAVVIP